MPVSACRVARGSYMDIVAIRPFFGRSAKINLGMKKARLSAGRVTWSYQSLSASMMIGRMRARTRFS